MNIQYHYYFNWKKNLKIQKSENFGGYEECEYYFPTFFISSKFTLVLILRIFFS